MTRTRGLIIVNYRSAALTAGAVASARRASDERLQVVVIDNSTDDREVAALHHCGADEILIAERNLGYAAAINRAVGVVDTDDVVLANPDVVFFPRSIDRLSELLASASVGAAGPRFCWDSAGQWLFPPALLPTRWTKEDEVMARKSLLWARLRDRRLFRSRERFWLADRPVRCSALSGAVLAVRRETFSTVDGFDDRYHLYFEEMDFLRRIRRKGKSLLVDPGAICRHLYNQSAGRSADSAARYVSSERLYFTKWYGEKFVRRYQRPLPPRAAAAFDSFSGELTIPDDLLPSSAIVEVSPMASFETAVGYFPATATVRIPAEVLESYRARELFIRVMDRRTARPLGRWVWTN